MALKGQGGWLKPARNYSSLPASWESYDFTAFPALAGKAGCSKSALADLASVVPATPHRGLWPRRWPEGPRKSRMLTKSAWQQTASTPPVLVVLSTTSTVVLCFCRLRRQPSGKPLDKAKALSGNNLAPILRMGVSAKPRAERDLPPEGGYLKLWMQFAVPTTRVGVSTPDFEFETYPSAQVADWQSDVSDWILR